MRSASAWLNAHRRGAGVDHELHRAAVDAAATDEVPAAAGGEDDFGAGAVLRRRAEPDRRRAQTQHQLPPRHIDLRIVAGQLEQLDALHGLPDRDGARHAIDDQQRHLVAQAAVEGDGLRRDGSGREQRCGQSGAANGKHRLHHQSRKLSNDSGASATSLFSSASPPAGRRAWRPTRAPFALDRGLHLQLALLDQRLDLLGQLGVDSGLDSHRLLHLVAADLLGLALSSRGSARRRRACSPWRAGCRAPGRAGTRCRRYSVS